MQKYTEFVDTVGIVMLVECSNGRMDDGDADAVR